MEALQWQMPLVAKFYSYYEWAQERALNYM